MKLDIIGLILHLVKAYYLITRMVESGKMNFKDAEIARLNIHNALEYFNLHSIVCGWNFHHKLDDESIEEEVRKAINMVRKKYSNEIYELKKINK